MARATILKFEKPSKYANQPVVVDGIRFDSKAEARRYHELLLLERARGIFGLNRQVSFPLSVGDVVIGHYVADFSYTEPGRKRETLIEVVEDLKSPASKTRLYEWKKKHLKAQYGITIRETKGRR